MQGPIDGPYRAALVPFLDPGFQVALGMAGAAGAIPSALGFVIEARGNVDGMPVDLEYRKSDDGVRSSGHLGEHAVSEHLHPLPAGNGLRFEGNVGNSPEDLVMVPTSEDLEVTGRLGAAEADLTMSFRKEGDELVLVIDGRLQGVPYRTVSRMTMDPSTYAGSMKTTGTVGTGQVDKEFELTPGEDGAYLIRGRGTVAGMRQDLDYRIVMG